MKNTFSHLQRDERGAVLPIFGLMVLFLIVIGGASIDVTRVVNAREKLSYALDAAALSVATDLSTSFMSNAQIEQAIEDSFRANMAGEEFLDVAIDNLAFTVDSDAGTITVTSSATLDNYFIDFGGYGTSAFGPEAFSFGTSAQVAYSRFDVELAMVVDVTGSMGWAIGDLRDAAESVVNILIPEDTGDPKVRISIVPYSVGVNLGSYAETATNNVSDRCATERDGSEKYTDASYTTEPIGDGSATYRSQECSDSELLPLSSNRTTLLDSIAALETDGYTAGQTGIGWGWYTLSPNWTDLWPTESQPASYDNTEVLKFALIMTDGAFNTYYDLENWTKQQCKNEKKKRDGSGNRLYNGKCYNGTNNYWVERSSSGLSGESSERAIDLCTEMKSSDIEIYSVYFGSSGSSSGARVMQACASDIDKTYYQASSADDLIQAFSNIAKKIQQIYLSQ